MRTKKTFYNTTSGILYEFVAIVCAFILPRLILSRFGSDYNGVVSSINQFLSWVSLLSAGIGGVTRAALYKPLNEKDTEKISSIMKATDLFMKKVAFIFIGLLFTFAIIYPFMVLDAFRYLFVFSMVLVLGINTFAQYYFGITYQTLLEADQRQYVYTIVRILTTFAGTMAAALLVILGFEIRLVYLTSSIIYACNPIFLSVYVGRFYKLDRHAIPDNTTVKQRWDAFVQELAIMINGNTDIIVLTAFCNVKIVSVYTVYNMVINGVKKLLQTFTTGVGAAFGNMMAQGKDNAYLNYRLRMFEFIVYNVTTILFSVTAMTIVPFISVYVQGVTDINYIRPAFGYLITIAAMFNCYRIPYQTIVYAAGKFKETRNGSIIEATLNIALSIVLVLIIGLNGVVVGTLVAAVFRTCQYAVYLSKNIILRSPWIFVRNIVVSLLICLFSVMFFNICVKTDVSSYFQWCVLAVKALGVVFIPMVIIDIILYRIELIGIIKMIKNIVAR